jgi:hypothetical protein
MPCLFNFDQLFSFGVRTLNPPRLHTEWSSAMQRRRFKNTLTFPDRLAKKPSDFDRKRTPSRRVREHPLQDIVVEFPKPDEPA